MKIYYWFNRSRFLLDLVTIEATALMNTPAPADPDFAKRKRLDLNRVVIP